MKYVSFTLVSYLLVSSTKYWRVAKNSVAVLKVIIENPYKNQKEKERLNFLKR